MTFRKSLAIYYETWFRNCHDSAVFCRERGNVLKAAKYLNDAEKYLNLIQDHWDAIEFFKVEDRAFLIDSAIPERFRGYE